MQEDEKINPELTPENTAAETIENTSENAASMKEAEAAEEKTEEEKEAELNTIADNALGMHIDNLPDEKDKMNELSEKNIDDLSIDEVKYIISKIGNNIFPEFRRNEFESHLKMIEKKAGIVSEVKTEVLEVGEDGIRVVSEAEAAEKSKEEIYAEKLISLSEKSVDEMSNDELLFIINDSTNSPLISTSKRLDAIEFLKSAELSKYRKEYAETLKFKVGDKVYSASKRIPSKENPVRFSTYSALGVVMVIVTEKEGNNGKPYRVQFPTGAIGIFEESELRPEKEETENK